MGGGGGWVVMVVTMVLVAVVTMVAVVMVVVGDGGGRVSYKGSGIRVGVAPHVALHILFFHVLLLLLFAGRPRRFVLFFFQRIITLQRHMQAWGSWSGRRVRNHHDSNLKS